MPVITIIVPIYKTEKYLCRCIDSILAQTFIDFECILVDDGSPDNCPAICDEYNVKDSRIVVIHQKNAGVSAARNAGLEIARGEWIGFVDSDDWCDSDMFRVLYDNAVRYDADVSICGYRKITNEKIKKNVKSKIQTFNAEQAIKKLFQPPNRMIDFNPANWNKLINAKIILQNKLRYDTTIQYAEDCLFIYEVFIRARKVVSFSRPYYNYFYNPESVTNRVGLICTSKTAFFPFDKIISLENSKKIKRKIIVVKIIATSNLCHNYIIQKDYVNDNFLFLKKFLVRNIHYLLFDLATPLHIKIQCCLINNPHLYILVRNSWNYVKQFFGYLLNKRFRQGALKM
jgi:glycosyltransferase involved in cell wall biosynthesis